MSEREIKNLLEDIYDAVMKIMSYSSFGANYPFFSGSASSI